MEPTPTQATDAPARPVTPKGINHMVLNVHDIDESHHFWSDILGFRQVGELHPQEGRPSVRMRFYSGIVDGLNHHDFALVEMPGLLPPPKEWTLFTQNLAISHIAIEYPDRESWLRQLEFLQAKGVELRLRVNHGMTHSVYLSDPNGYGIEVLYELPEDVWRDDIDGALNYAEVLPRDAMLVDDTNYPSTFA